MNNTKIFAGVKGLDYVSTKLNFWIWGDTTGELNPLAKYFFDNNEIGIFIMMGLTILFYAWAERRYKDTGVIKYIQFVTFITGMVVLSNFYVFFYSLWYLI